MSSGKQRSLEVPLALVWTSERAVAGGRRRSQEYEHRPCIESSVRGRVLQIVAAWSDRPQSPHFQAPSGSDAVLSQSRGMRCFENSNRRGRPSSQAALVSCASTRIE
jgi:hypothetical protein